MNFLKENTPLITNLATLGSFLGLILLFHVESRNDFRHMDAQIQAIHVESRNDFRHMDAQIQAIHAEIKDFHGRLCAIEERRNKS